MTWLCGEAQAPIRAARRPAVKVHVGLLGTDPLDPPLDAHLPLQVVPEEDQCRPGIGLELACFAALVVGEKRESPLVDPAQQHDPGRRPSVRRCRWPASWHSVRGRRFASPHQTSARTGGSDRGRHPPRGDWNGCNPYAARQCHDPRLLSIGRSSLDRVAPWHGAISGCCIVRRVVQFSPAFPADCTHR